MVGGSRRLKSSLVPSPMTLLSVTLRMVAFEEIALLRQHPGLIDPEKSQLPG